MGTESRFKMSRERLDELKQELEYLQTVREKEIAEQIKEARSFGDLSENSEYDDAKTEQGKVYSRIAEVKVLIENAEIIEMTGPSGMVGHGSTVKVRNLEENEIEVYQIVGSQEANPMIGHISSDSPFGRSLLGRSAGEQITVDAPAGQFRFEILEIDN